MKKFVVLTTSVLVASIAFANQMSSSHTQQIKQLLATYQCRTNYTHMQLKQELDWVVAHPSYIQSICHGNKNCLTGIMSLPSEAKGFSNVLNQRQQSMIYCNMARDDQAMLLGYFNKSQ